MVVIQIRGGEIKQFNLSTFDREKKLHAAWYAMYSDEKYLTKKVKITTTENETIELKINDIQHCQFTPAVYIKKEPKKEPPKTAGVAEDIIRKTLGMMEEKKKERVTDFLNMTDKALKQRGVKGGLGDVFPDKKS